MTILSKNIATDIALCHREIETAETLLADIEKQLSTSAIEQEDIRDVFGRRPGGLQLGVPTGNSGQRLYQVPWTLAKPVIKAHIAAKRAELEALSIAALNELNGTHKEAAE